MRHWIKLYTEALDDPKLHRLSDKEYRAYMNLLMLAGIVDRGGEIGNLEEISFRLRIPQSRAKQILQKICQKGIQICSGSTENYVISAFSHRQEKPPSAKPNAVAARVAQHRAAKQGKSSIGNDVTPSLHPIGNDPVTTLEENRTDKNRIDKEGAASPPPAGNVPSTNGKTDKSPAVLLYHSTVKLWPNTTQEAAINRVVQDLAKWQLVVDAWRMRGIKPTNVDCLIDWYEHGIPEGKPNAIPNRNSSGPSNGTYRPQPVDPTRPKIKPFGSK